MSKPEDKLYKDIIDTTAKLMMEYLSTCKTEEDCVTAMRTYINTGSNAIANGIINFERNYGAEAGPLLAGVTQKILDDLEEIRNTPPNKAIHIYKKEKK